MPPQLLINQSQHQPTNQLQYFVDHRMACSTRKAVEETHVSAAGKGVVPTHEVTGPQGARADLWAGEDRVRIVCMTNSASSTVTRVGGIGHAGFGYARISLLATTRKTVRRELVAVLLIVHVVGSHQVSGLLLSGR